MHTNPRDAQLVAAGVSGDHEAFAALADRHRHRAGAVVLAMLGDPAEAEDVVQEALLRAYTDLRRLRDPNRFGGWLCGIAVNLAKMQLRRRNGLLSLEEFADRLDVRETLAASPEHELEGADSSSEEHSPTCRLGSGKFSSCTTRAAFPARKSEHTWDSQPGQSASAYTARGDGFVRSSLN